MQGKTTPIRERCECIHILDDRFLVGLFDIFYHDRPFGVHSGAVSRRRMENARRIGPHLYCAASIRIRYAANDLYRCHVFHNSFDRLYSDDDDQYFYR